MAEAWRIVKKKHAATAFDGEGAAKAGGRWNSPGIRIVYTSATLSLAALESLVHLNPPVYFSYVKFRIEVDDALIEAMPVDRLPAGWSVNPPGAASMTIGDQWVIAGRTAVLKVPSVIIPGESSYLLNPSHPDFGRITIGNAEVFTFDPRLFPIRR